MGGDSKAGDVGQNPLTKALITGPAVLLEMLTGGLFMENLKMEKQRTSHPYYTIARRTLNQGLRGFWAGFMPWGFTLGMAKGTVLGGARSGFLNLFSNHTSMTAGQADVASGFCAGGVQGIFMSPILLARTKVNQHLADRAIQSGGKIESSGMKEVMISFSILNSAIKNEGLGMVLTGMPTMIFKRSMDWGSRFVLMRMFREYFHSLKDDPSEPLNNYEKLGSAFIGGSLAVFITMPIDRLMPIIQASRVEAKPIMTVVKELYAKEGLATLQRGLLMRVIHCGWHTTFAIFLANRISDVVQKRFG